MSTSPIRSGQQIMNIKVSKATFISRLLDYYLTVPDVIQVKIMHTIWLQLAVLDRTPTITHFYPLFYFSILNVYFIYLFIYLIYLFSS